MASLSSPGLLLYFADAPVYWPHQHVPILSSLPYIFPSFFPSFSLRPPLDGETFQHDDLQIAFWLILWQHNKPPLAP